VLRVLLVRMVRTVLRALLVTRALLELLVRMVKTVLRALLVLRAP
jgi:hypothetical protein